VVIKCATSSIAQPPVQISMYLLKCVPWAKFIGICGILIWAVTTIGGLVAGASDPRILPSIIPWSALFIPVVFLLRFARSLKVSATDKSSINLEESFKHLMSYFKSIGILILVYIAVSILTLFIILVTKY
jgi:hypothetical protein